jgi:hypothetical protein
MWTQIVGKIRLRQSPWANHSWNVTLYVTPRGLTTSSIPYGFRSFEIEFDFIAHELIIRTNDGKGVGIPLQPESVADFYKRFMGEMDRLHLPVKIHMKPNEVENPILFDRDEIHKSYDPAYARRFWQILVQSDRVFKQFRALYLGKCSPVHFFWGAPDLAVTRFSGRRAPKHPGGVPGLPDWVAGDAYSHEVSSVGFWPGGGAIEYPAFYSYAYPEPDGFPKAAITPESAFYSSDLKEFILPYEAVRKSESQDQALMDFMQSTYDAAANLGKWDRHELEYRHATDGATSESR